MRHAASIDTLLSLLAELLFIILPLLVWGFVFTLHQGKDLAQLVHTPEWSFAASILFGQGLVKFVAGVTKARALVWERVAAVVAACIVLGLIPSLTVLALIMITATPQPELIAAQLVLFALSVVGFVALGGIGHYWLSRNPPETPSK